MRLDLQKKVEWAIHLLRSIAPQDGSIVEVAYSGGKDSDVVLQLVKESGIPFRAVYKNTTIDPPGTIRHVKQMGVGIIAPRNHKGFFQLIAEKGYPSRRRRFCCKELKEYKLLDTVVLGIRKEESVARNKRYKEPIVCKIYNKENHVNQVLPILSWTQKDVQDFLQDRGIQCAPIYYDEDGTFHPERRLGCMACPLGYKKHRIEEFKKNPNLIKAYIRAGKKYMDSHPNSKVCKLYDDVYEYFFRNLFIESQDQHDIFKRSLWGRPDYKGLIEQYFNIKL